MQTASANQSSTDALANDAPLVWVRTLRKSFPGVVAVDDVSLSLYPGEIVSLLGQNGAGKSTLIQVLSGIHTFGTYEGEIFVEGEMLRATSVADSEAAGIAFLAQEVNVAPDLTIAQTLWLNNEPLRFGMLDEAKMMADAREALAGFGLDIDPAREMISLDLATQQLVLIVRALSKNAKLLILDEPTAALNEREASRLFEHMKSLAAQGVAIIFVSHRLAEVFQVSDRIIVMRDGRIAGEFPAKDTSRDAVVEQMVGRHIEMVQAAAPGDQGKAALRVTGLTVHDVEDPSRVLVEDVGFQIRDGEILGLFGLLGSGVVEAAMALFGAWRGQVSGQFEVQGASVSIPNPQKAAELGIGLIGQDRRHGLIGEHTILENAVLANLDALSNRFGFVDTMRARREVADIFQRLNIKAAGIDIEIGTLSGGNQQKVQIARWLQANVRTMILIDPTRGVDIGARTEITRIWTELAASGASILLVSSDAQELIETCHRAVVLRHGRQVAEVMHGDMTEERLLRLAAGL